MTNLITEMKKEQEYLEQMKGRVEKDIRKDDKHKLPGKLRIQKKGNSVQYYHTQTKQSTEDKYPEKIKDKKASKDNPNQSPDDRTQQLLQDTTNQITRNTTNQITGNTTNQIIQDKTNQITKDKTNQDNPSEQYQTYIPKKNIQLARNLAQRDYDEKLLQEIGRRQKALSRFIKEYPGETLEQVYYGINDYRKELVHPIIETDEQYEKVWLSTPYIRKEIGDDVPVILTENGERVRSKSEKMIADKLKHMGIPYRYEAPLRLSRSTILHPDFTLLNVKERKEVYYEHFGMMDKPEYVESALNRIELYEKNRIFPGDRLLFSWETMSMPLNMRLVEEKIRGFFL